MLFVLFFVVFIAVVFIKHGLNDKPIPWQYGMKCKLQRLGREWKGILPFNIYAPHLMFETVELWCDQTNGHWKSNCFLNLNSKPKQRKGDEYMILVSIVAAELIYFAGASNDMILKLDEHCIHRPTSINRYLRDKGEQNGLEVDKKRCNEILDACDIAKKSGTSVENALRNLNQKVAKSVSVSSSSVDDSTSNLNNKLNDKAEI